MWDLCTDMCDSVHVNTCVGASPQERVCARSASYRQCLQPGDSFCKRIFLGAWAAEAVTAPPPGLTVKTVWPLSRHALPVPACPCLLWSPSPHPTAALRRLSALAVRSPREEDPRGHPAHGACPSREGMSLQSAAVTQTETASSCFSRTG